MKAIDMINEIVEYAGDYRKEAQLSLPRNRHTNEIEDGEVVQQRHIDAVLVDFINYIGVRYGIDYALYVSDLDSDTW